MFDDDVSAGDPAEPDWLSDPVYADTLTAGERVQALAALAPTARPGPVLGHVDPRALSEHELVDLLTVLEQQRRWIEALQLRVLAQLQASDRSKLGLAQEQASLALQVPPRTAQRRLAAATTVTGELPATLGLLAAGRISARHVEILTDAVWKLTTPSPDAGAAETAWLTQLPAVLEQQVLHRAPDQTAPQFAQTVRRAVMTLDPAGSEQRHKRASAERTVDFQPLEDGMCALRLILPAPEGQAIYTRLTAATELLPAEDPRTVAQQRADLVVDAILTGLPHDALPTHQGRRPSLQITVSADTLLGLDDQPAHLTAYGPITAHHARRLAADQSGTWRRLLTDPDTGHLLDLSPHTYRPGRRLADFVAARDDTCTFPTCNQPGYRCHYEHTTPFGRGGTTCRCNGALACPRHNNCKIDTGWGYTHNPDGTYTWTTHTGHSYTSHPPRPPAPKPERSPAPEPAMVADLHEAADIAYRALIHRTTTELHTARTLGDHERAQHALTMLTGHRKQRARQLAHRRDPDEPPF